MGDQCRSSDIREILHATDVSDCEIGSEFGEDESDFDISDGNISDVSLDGNVDISSRPDIDYSSDSEEKYLPNEVELESSEIDEPGPSNRPMPTMYCK